MSSGARIGDGDRILQPDRWQRASPGRCLKYAVRLVLSLALGVPLAMLSTGCGKPVAVLSQRSAPPKPQVGLPQHRNPPTPLIYEADRRHANVQSRRLTLWANGTFEITPHKGRRHMPCGLAVVWGAPGEWGTFRGTYVRRKDRLVLTGSSREANLVAGKVLLRRYELRVGSKDTLRDSLGAKFRRRAPSPG